MSKERMLDHSKYKLWIDPVKVIPYVHWTESGETE